MTRRALDWIAALFAALPTAGRRLAISFALATLALPAPSSAQDGYLLPLGPDDPLELGTGWDRDDNRARGESGACVLAIDTERIEGGPTTYSLLVLSRAGGRLVVGVHVARTLASEGMRGASITDAARRLATQGREDFDVLCGSGFLAARAVGGQYVGELAFESVEARRAPARLETGVWTDPARFAAAIEGLTAGARVQAREFPDGRRSDAREIEPAELLSRALALPETVTEDTAKPFLGAIRGYPDAAFAGTEIAIDSTLGWGDAARQVFLHDRTTLSGSSAAVRAAEMRKAVVQRRQPVPTETAVALPNDPAAAMAVAAAGDGAEAPPAALAGTPSPAAPAPIHRTRMAALVYAVSDGATVFATTHAPPGVYAEKVKQREYWIPGVAEPDAEIRATLARAAQAPPDRGTTILVAEVGTTGVVMTDVAPVAGTHAVPAGALQAWIAGVRTPTPAQREALAAAAAQPAD
jgi:hypothetical protein